MGYRCFKACTWKKRYYAPGDIYEGPETPPAIYFETYSEPEPETSDEPVNPTDGITREELKRAIMDVVEEMDITGPVGPRGFKGEKGEPGLTEDEVRAVVQSVVGGGGSCGCETATTEEIKALCDETLK